MIICGTSNSQFASHSALALQRCVLSVSLVNLCVGRGSHFCEQCAAELASSIDALSSKLSEARNDMARDCAEEPS